MEITIPRRKSYLSRLVLIKEKYWLGYLENSFSRYRESLDGPKHPLSVTIQCDDVALTWNPQ